MTLLLYQFLKVAGAFLLFFFFFWPVFPLPPLADLLPALQLSLLYYNKLIQSIFVVGADFCGSLLNWLPPLYPAVRQCDFQVGKIGKRLTPNYHQPEICGVTLKIDLCNFFTGMALLWWYMLTCKYVLVLWQNELLNQRIFSAGPLTPNFVVLNWKQCYQ